MIYVYMKSDLINVDSLLITYFLPLIIIAYIWKIKSRETLIFDKCNVFFCFFEGFTITLAYDVGS